MGVHRLLFIGLVVLASACETTPEERVTTACTLRCGCTQPALPALQDRCIAKCTSDQSLTNACIACISANSDRCATLEKVCAPSCSQAPPTGQDGAL